MAEGKKSFVAYCDWGEIFDELEDKEAGKLVKHLFDYVRDRDPQTDDKLIKMLFIQMQQSLKRDLNKWDGQKVKRAEAGRLGGLAKASNAKQKLANLAVNDSVSVSVSVNDNVNGNDNESVINMNTHPALIGFRNNVFKEAKEQGIKIEVAEGFFKYWTAIDEHTKLFLYQATEPFGIQNRLKNWQLFENKNNSTFKKVNANDFEL